LAILKGASYQDCSEQTIKKGRVMRLRVTNLKDKYPNDVHLEMKEVAVFLLKKNDLLKYYLE
jgi:hypothetical protein